jgi:hypothetical protein
VSGGSTSKGHRLETGLQCVDLMHQHVMSQLLTLLGCLDGILLFTCKACYILTLEETGRALQSGRVDKSEAMRRLGYAVCRSCADRTNGGSM